MTTQQDLQKVNERANKIAHHIQEAIFNQADEGVTIKYTLLSVAGETIYSEDITVLVQVEEPIKIGFGVFVQVETANGWHRQADLPGQFMALPTGKIRVTCKDPYDPRVDKKWLHRKNDLDFSKRYAEIAKFVLERFAYDKMRRIAAHEKGLALKVARNKCLEEHGAVSGKLQSESSPWEMNWSASTSLVDSVYHPCIDVYTNGIRPVAIKIDMLNAFEIEASFLCWDDIKI